MAAWPPRTRTSRRGPISRVAHLERRAWRPFGTSAPRLASGTIGHRMVDMGRIRKFVRAALFVVAVGIVVMRFASCGGDGGLCRAGCLCARTPEACGSGCFPTYQRTDGGTTFFCANGPGLNDSGAGAVDGTTDADRDGPADGGGAGDRSDANLGDLSSSNCNMVSDPCNYYRPYCQPDGTCKNCNELGP